MKLINSSSVVDLRICVPDANDEQKRLKDFDKYTVKVYTVDESEYVELNENTGLSLKGRMMREQKDGVIHLKVWYSSGDFEADAELTTDYYFQKSACTKQDKEPPTPTISKRGQNRGDVSNQNDQVKYIDVKIEKNIKKMRWSELSKEEKIDVGKLIGADLAGFTKVLTEDEYDILVDTNKVDDNVFYFIEETE